MKKAIATGAIVSCGILMGMTGVADAADELRYENEAFLLEASFGYTWLQGDELVYDDFGNRISHLIWNTEAPVLTLGANAALTGNWRLMGDATIGFAGDSHMEDYDWLEPYSPSYDFEDWSHRSVHPGTELDRYIDLSIALGRDFEITPAATLNLQGGFKYTNTKWTSYGGSYVYSYGGFRNLTGTFPDVAGVTYEQRFPTLFVGSEVTAEAGQWTFSGLVRGGAAINAQDIDHHWLRDLLFKESFDPVPFVSVGARVEYDMSSRGSFFVAGNYDKYFSTKGDTNIYDIPSGAFLDGPYVDGVGIEFEAMSISAGFSLKF